MQYFFEIVVTYFYPKPYIQYGELGRIRGKYPKKLGLLAEVSLDTAVYIKNLTIYEIRCRGGKEYCGACKVLGIAPATCGSLGLGDENVEGMLGSVRLGLTKGSSLRSSDVTGSDTVTLNVEFTVL